MLEIIGGVCIVAGAWVVYSVLCDIRDGVGQIVAHLGAEEEDDDDEPDDGEREDVTPPQDAKAPLKAVANTKA